MDAEKLRSLQLTAAKVRLGIVTGVFNAKSGHPGGSLSAADIFKPFSAQIPIISTASAEIFLSVSS